MTVYTSGDWYVTPGREAEFVSAWNEFAQWSNTNIDSSSKAKLLRDHEDSSHFVSFGSWPDEATVDRWRASDGFRERVPKLKAMTESMKIRTLDVVAETKMMQTIP